MRNFKLNSINNSINDSNLSPKANFNNNLENKFDEDINENISNNNSKIYYLFTFSNENDYNILISKYENNKNLKELLGVKESIDNNNNIYCVYSKLKGNEKIFLKNF